MKTNKKTIFLSILLFIFVIAALGIPFKNWWCNSNDDFHGLYLGYKAKTCTDVLNFFRDGHVNKDLGPTNIGKRDQPTTFFSTYYRPIHCILLSVQHWIFGTKVYYYFLVN